MVRVRLRAERAPDMGHVLLFWRRTGTWGLGPISFPRLARLGNSKNLNGLSSCMYLGF